MQRRIGLEKHVALGRTAELFEAFVGSHGEGLLLHSSFNGSDRLAVDLFQRSLNAHRERFRSLRR